jgi:hypothetical protein
MQRIMDELGLLTCINKVGRNGGRRYEVVINGELKKKYRKRIRAKKFLLARFSEKLMTV